MNQERAFLDSLLIWRHIMLTSATRSTVKMRAKSQNVTITDVAGTADTEAIVGRRSCTVHGWRPTSATAHHASEQTHMKGTDTIAIHCIQDERCSSVVLYTMKSTAMKKRRK